MNRDEAHRRAVAAVGATELAPGTWLDLEEDCVLAFHNFVINEYEPPEDKRLLVFFQCSIRRPFYTSPSHGPMRRAIKVATGCDPWYHFEKCPVHVVVLASMVGPAPYELQDVFPVNVRSGGVKHFGPEYYAFARPILAERMAEYITAHRDCYDRFATFTESRYADVMYEARQIANVDCRIYPDEGGARVVRMGKSVPRTYWQKYWIQLYREIVSWLKPAERRAAAARLKKLDVVCTRRADTA